MANQQKYRQPMEHESGTGKIKEDTPLTPLEQKFVHYYIECGNVTLAMKRSGAELKTDAEYKNMGLSILKLPNVRAEIRRLMADLRNETIATAQEVLSYFTSVMRGETKDQFGLDAPLSERTKAAQELAKRTFDIDNRASGNPDSLVQVKIDWKREA